MSQEIIQEHWHRKSLSSSGKVYLSKKRKSALSERDREQAGWREQLPWGLCSTFLYLLRFGKQQTFFQPIQSPSWIFPDQCPSPFSVAILVPYCARLIVLLPHVTPAVHVINERNSLCDIFSCPLIRQTPWDDWKALFSTYWDVMFHL